MAVIAYSGGGAIGRTTYKKPTTYKPATPRNTVKPTYTKPKAAAPTWLQQYNQKTAAARNATTVAQAKYNTQYYDQLRAKQRNETTVAQAKRNASQWYQAEYGNQNRTYMQQWADNPYAANARFARETSERRPPMSAYFSPTTQASQPVVYQSAFDLLQRGAEGPPAPTQNVVYQSAFDLLQRGAEGPPAPYSYPTGSTATNYGGYGGYSGGGYSSGGGSTYVPATPDIPKWLYGLINWRV